MTKGSDLFDYVRIQYLEDDIVCELIEPFSKWPETLNATYGWLIRAVMAGSTSDELLEYPQQIAFCRDVCACPGKPDSDENPNCYRYQLGVCCDATYPQNEGTIPGRALASILGWSPARVHQITVGATAKLRRLTMADPHMVEMCEEWSVGGTMPTSKKMAADFE